MHATGECFLCGDPSLLSAPSLSLRPLVTITSLCSLSSAAPPPACTLAADGVYTGEFTTMALCGFIRGMGEGDGALDRLWTKCYDDAKAAGSDI